MTKEEPEGPSAVFSNTRAIRIQGKPDSKGDVTKKQAARCANCHMYRELLDSLRKAVHYARPEEVAKYRALIEEIIVLVAAGREEHRDIRCDG